MRPQADESDPQVMQHLLEMRGLFAVQIAARLAFQHRQRIDQMLGHLQVKRSFIRRASWSTATPRAR